MGYTYDNLWYLKGIDQWETRWVEKKWYQLIGLCWNLNVKSSKQDLSIDTTFNPPLFSLDNSYKELLLNNSWMHIFLTYTAYDVDDSSIYEYPRITILLALCINVYLGAACLPLNVVENQTTVGRLCRLVTGNATGHSWRTSVNSATKETSAIPVLRL